MNQMSPDQAREALALAESTQERSTRQLNGRLWPSLLLLPVLFMALFGTADVESTPWRYGLRIGCVTVVMLLALAEAVPGIGTRVGLRGRLRLGTGTQAVLSVVVVVGFIVANEVGDALDRHDAVPLPHTVAALGAAVLVTGAYLWILRRARSTT
jgi:hypothetical protein